MADNPDNAQSSPSDIALERAMLGAILSDNSALDRLAGLEADDFFDPLNAAVFSAAQDLRSDNRPVNLVTLRGRMGHQVFDSCEALIADLKRLAAGSLPESVDIARQIRDLSLRRQLQALGEQIMGSVWDLAASPGTLMADAQRALDELTAKTRGVHSRTRFFAEVIDETIAGLDGPSSDSYFSTGFNDLDRMIGGWWRGDYIVLGGRPSMGKSAMAVSAAKRVANKGIGAVVFSLEMTGRQWCARHVTDAAWTRDNVLAYTDALRGDLDPRKKQRFIEAAERSKNAPLIIDEQANLSVSDIASRVRTCRHMLEDKGVRLSMVIIDHLGKVRPSKRYRGDRVREIGDISRGLAELGKEENVAVLALCQLNRGTEGRDNKRPGLSDLRDSGDIEQDADTVMFAYRPAYYLERQKFDAGSDEEISRLQSLERYRNVLEIGIAKQRNGPTGNIELFCDMAANAVRDAWRGQ